MPDKSFIREDKTVTVLIVTYKKFDKIYDSLNSVLNQKYPYIELIIQDDGSPNFDEYYNSINKYIDDNNKGNIIRKVINHSKINHGTSRNVNIGIKLMKGKYLKLLTPDDMLYSEDTLSDSVAFCEEYNSSILIGQTYVMRRGDRTIFDSIEDSIAYRWKARSGKRCILSPSNKDIDYLRDLSDEDCRRVIASCPIISTPSVFYREDLVKETNGFPETYKLMEDMPYWPLLAKKGVKFYFSNIRMVRYELSGISNGGEHSKEFLSDYYDVMKSVYIENDLRGGIFNPLVKLYRSRKAYYFSFKDNGLKSWKYLDVQLGRLFEHTKYLLTGSRF